MGIGPTWFASPAENKMRYVVLVVMAAAVVCGCVALKEALGVAGERFYSTPISAGVNRLTLLLNLIFGHRKANSIR